MTRLAGLLRENWLTILVIGALVIAFLVLRSSPTDIASLESFDADLQRGSPTIVYFYSNT